MTPCDRNSPARNARFCAIDFETTGSVPGRPSLPWQVGLALRDGAAEPPKAAFDSLIRVAQAHPFSRHAPGDHAARRSEIAAAPEQDEIWQKIHPFLATSVIVAHNLGTERTLLNRMAPLHRYGPWVDTLVLTRKIYPGLGDYALESLIGRLGLLPDLTAAYPAYRPHDACSDALACAFLLDHILCLPGWHDAPLSTLITHD